MHNLCRRSRFITYTALIGFLMFASLMSGCQRAIESVLPTATQTPVLTSTRRLVTPTVAASPTPAALPTPTIIPSPTPDTRIQTTFAPDEDPLTGIKVADPTVLNRRPLAIKVSNYPPEVRPQRGLSQADLVFEHILEGVTRLTAVFYSQTPELVGSVRSARYLDLEIPVMYKSFFGYSGSSGGILSRCFSR